MLIVLSRGEVGRGLAVWGVDKKKSTETTIGLSRQEMNVGLLK